MPKNLWPNKLSETPFPPENLWYLGQVPVFSQKFLAIVGSRKFSDYGKLACENIIEGLRGYPITIVSGLAVGIDTVAHTKAMDVGLKCLAIPGSGLSPKVLYPPKNHRLADRIIDDGGCLLSEFEPEMPALPWMFPQRNRIMAGISDAVLIIEAEEKSGTLITARLALDYNRDVLTIPHSIFSQYGKGSNKLLRDGAHLVTSAKDVLHILGFETEENIQRSFDFKDFSKEEIAIIEALDHPQSLDELVSKIDLPLEKITQAITLLEIKNVIIQTKNFIQLK